MSAAIKVRQPLGSLELSAPVPLDQALLDIIADEVNVKKITTNSATELSVQLDTTLTDELRAEGLARELIRHIQQGRKQAGLEVENHIELSLSVAKAQADQLRTKGKVVRGWIGVILEDKIDEATAKVFGAPDQEGSLVKEALPDYPAARAGLKRGDIIREFNGKKVKNTYELQSLVSAADPGETVPLKIIRDKKELTLQIKIGEAPDSLSAVKGKSADGQVEPRGESDPGQKWMGLTVRELTPDLREQAGVSASQSGVIVSAVEENSKLEDAGILPGDVIVAVNQQPVPDLKAFKEVVKKVKLSSGVVFDLLRRGEALYLSYLGPDK
jgi:serine protease Do